MENINYNKLGFKCGIEIHQQLEGKKLFCKCPTIIRKNNPHYILKRFLRSSAGEIGKTDKAAKYEETKKKYFLYEGYNDINCLVEQDEEPPHTINEEALASSIQICSMLNCKISEKIIFMRKIVVDGSNVSGFQRTALIGSNGYIEVEGRKIKIDSICLEEESCQTIKRTEKYDIYNLSRLGIPLIEIATAPDIKNPEECKKVAAKLGMLLRSLKNCKRGIGSIRQDVNISIKKGYRVEIKGFQDLKSIPKIINFEINRQINEKEKNVPHVRKAEPDFSTSYLRPMPGANRMYPETDIPLIEADLSKIKIIKTLEEKEKEYEEKYNLNKDFASLAVKFEDKNNYNFNFNNYKKLKAKFVVNFIVNLPKNIKKRYNLDINTRDYEFLLNELDNNNISESSIEEILVKLAKDEKVNLKDYKTLPVERIEKEILKIINENKNLPFGALMGKCMQQFKGKVDGKIVNEIINKNLK